MSERASACQSSTSCGLLCSSIALLEWLQALHDALDVERFVFPGVALIQFLVCPSSDLRVTSPMAHNNQAVYSQVFGKLCSGVISKILCCAASEGGHN